MYDRRGLNQQRSLARAALTVSAATVLSTLTGFAMRLVLAARFGAGAQLDAFYTAFRLPDLLFNLLAGGALASAFIPTFTARLAQSQIALAWSLARRVATFVFFGMALVAAVCTIFAPQLVAWLIAPGFDATQSALTVSLMRVMLISTVIFGVSGLLMGVLQANQQFLAPALAPSVYNLGILFGAVTLSGLGIMGAAIGVALGALLHLLVQLPALRNILKTQNLSTPHAPFTAKDADLKNILRLMLPRMLGMGATQVNFLINTRLASAMGDGAVSSLNLAWSLMLMSLAVMAQAMGIVMLPALSAHAARGERSVFGAQLTRSLSVVLLLSLAASVGLILLGQPLIRLLFERNAFDAQSTQYVSFALTWFAVGLIGHSALELLTRGFYALQDTLRPVIIGVCAVLLNIVLSVVLSRMFAQIGWLPFGGVALANSIATLLEAAIMLWLLARRATLTADTLRGLRDDFAKAIAAAVVMALVLYAVRAQFGAGIAAILLAVVLGGAVFFGVNVLLRHSALGMLAARFTRKSKTPQS